MRRLILLLSFVLSSCSLLWAQEVKHVNDYYFDAEKAFNKQRWAEADSLANLYCLVCERELTDKIKSYPYTRMLDLRAHCAARALNYDAAIALEQKAVDLRRQATDCEQQHIAVALNELSLFYSYKGNYDEAIRKSDEALKILRESYGEKNKYYAVTLSNMASFLSSRGDEGDFQRAVKLGEEAIKHIPKGSVNYANALNSLVVYYAQVGSYTKSNEYGKKAVNLGKKRYGELSFDNAAMLSNLAVRLANVRNYEKALEYANLARSIYQRMNATRQLGYTRLLGNMASFNAQLEKNEECLALLNEELPLLRELVGESHPDYVRCHSELSSAYSRMGNYEKAEEVGQMAQQITDSTTLSDPRYAQAMSREANTLAMNGNFERAVEMENRALQVFTNRRDHS